MPTYDYECSNCGYKFEEYHIINERYIPEENLCPKCNQKKIKKSLVKVQNAFIDPYRLGRIKKSDGFKEVLTNIKKGNPGSTIDV